MNLRPLTTTFDKYWARVIGKIPAWYRPWLHRLGIMTMPVVWGGILGALLVLRVLPEPSFYAAFAIIALIPLGSILKAIIRRKRPPTIYANHMKIKTSSFPSGHAYAAMLAAGYLAYTAFVSGQWLITILLAILIFIIGISRVHLGAHYPSDVLGGWTLGVVVLGLIISLIP